MGDDNIITVSCAAVSHHILADCLEKDVLPEIEHDFVGAEILKEGIKRLKDMACPAGMTGRRSYDQQR
jgi:hypothetical protein